MEDRNKIGLILRAYKLNATTIEEAKDNIIRIMGDKTQAAILGFIGGGTVSLAVFAFFYIFRD